MCYPRTNAGAQCYGSSAQNNVIASLPLPQRELVRAPSPQAERGLTACLLPSFSACGIVIANHAGVWGE